MFDLMLTIQKDPADPSLWFFIVPLVSYVVYKLWKSDFYNGK